MQIPNVFKFTTLAIGQRGPKHPGMSYALVSSGLESRRPSRPGHLENKYHGIRYGRASALETSTSDHVTFFVPANSQPSIFGEFSLSALPPISSSSTLATLLAPFPSCPSPSSRHVPELSG